MKKKKNNYKNENKMLVIRLWSLAGLSQGTAAPQTNQALVHFAESKKSWKAIAFIQRPLTIHLLVIIFK